jgi:thioredoxin reductase (NADPH)
MTAGELEVVIAGAGIAGLTAGLTSARLGRKTLILTGGVSGGQLLSIEKVDGFPGFPEGIAGYDLCPLIQEQAVAAGAEFAAGALEVIEPADEGRWRLMTGEGAEYLARAVVVATGARLKELGVAGEERLRGKGVSHCASCDAPLMRGRTVVVVGGGDSAAQEALTLADSAARVVILHRSDAFSAQAAYRERVTAHPKIEIRFNVTVEEILGDSGVAGVRLRETATGASATLEAAGVFVYVGMEPNSTVLKGKLALDSAGRVPTDAAMRTALHGVFAAGAVRSGWLGRAMSAGEGAAAAIAAARYLSDDRWREGQ